VNHAEEQKVVAAEKQPEKTAAANAASGLNTTSGEFVPQGHFRPTDDAFPDMDSAFDEPAPKKKSKKEAKVKVDAPTEEDLATLHKGKPSNFFGLDSSNTPNSK